MGLNLNTSNLHHRHGGRILSLDSIEVESWGKGKSKRYCWEFVGRVKWDDGTESPAARISPICICHEPDDSVGEEQARQASAAMNDYLRAHGTWDDKRGWIPRAA